MMRRPHRTGRSGTRPSARVRSAFSIRKLAIEDKHGLRRNAFNAKVNIHRRGAEPILLGIEDRQLREDTRFSVSTAQLIRSPVIGVQRAGE